MRDPHIQSCMYHIFQSDWYKHIHNILEGFCRVHMTFKIYSTWIVFITCLPLYVVDITHGIDLSYITAMKLQPIIIQYCWNDFRNFCIYKATGKLCKERNSVITYLKESPMVFGWIWFLAHLSLRLKWAFLITICQLSVVVVVVVNFSYFHLLLQNHRANFNQTLHNASLGKWDSNSFTWRAPPFSKGR